jgi:hypothetical protein
MSRLKPSNRLLVAGGGVVPAALRVVLGLMCGGDALLATVTGLWAASTRRWEVR